MLLDGTVVRANRTLLRWIGREADDVVGRRFQDLLAPGARIFFETHCRPMLLVQGRAQEIALDLTGSDGAPLPVLLSGEVHPAEDGRPEVCQAALFVARDRRTYERELVRARRRAEGSEAQARLLAATLQESLLPHALPEIEGVELAARFRPAGKGDEIGGDFYDVFETGRHDWMVVIGDVCGKGAQAATVTALARYTIRAAAMRVRRPRQVLATLNDAILRQHVERFCTASCARLRPRSGRTGSALRVTISSGGHPLPFLVTGAGARQVGKAGTLLGIYEDVRLHDLALDLATDDVLVWFTDGVTEARRGREEFGEHRVREVLDATRDLSADAVADRLVEAVTGFQDGLPRDDLAVVVLRVAD